MLLRAFEAHSTPDEDNLLTGKEIKALNFYAHNLGDPVPVISRFYVFGFTQYQGLQQSDSAISRMRWLCLHGRGTSAQIFEMQTVRIREALGRDHEFVFVNGTVSTEPDIGADAIADEFFGYVAHDADQDRELCDNMIEFVESQGPFDGFMGFSEGGTVAAMMLVEDARHGSFGGIKCAVFFCAALPFDPDQARTGVIRYIDPDTDGVLLTIPTAHIWAQTAGAHEIKVHQSLTQICDERVREVFLHDLGHDVPGAKSDKGLAGALRAIEHVIENAMDSTR